MLTIPFSYACALDSWQLSFKMGNKYVRKGAAAEVAPPSGNNCCCSTRLVGPTKKPLRKGKKAQRCLWHCSIKWIQLKSVRSICQDQPTALNQRGRIITCVFWAHKNMDKFTTCGFIQTPSSWFSFALNLQILKVNRSVSKCDCQAVCTWPYISSGDFSVQRICVNKSVPPGV